MAANIQDMKLKEVLPLAGEREVAKIDYRKLDKYGRLYIDISKAKKDFLVILLEPIAQDKIDFLEA